MVEGFRKVKSKMKQHATPNQNDDDIFCKLPTTLQAWPLTVVSGIQYPVTSWLHMYIYIYLYTYIYIYIYHDMFVHM